MTADERTMGAIEDVRLAHLEAQIVQIIATRMGLDAASALGVWYGSDLCRGVELNEFGLQYLDASYLVDELMAREGPRPEGAETPRPAANPLRRSARRGVWGTVYLPWVILGPFRPTGGGPPRMGR